jgi:AraC-like DNA-binding protein
MDDGETLKVESLKHLEPQNAGLFVSAGHGQHATRTLTTFELVFVRAGELELFEDDRLFTVRRNQTLLLWPGRTHGATGPFPRGLQFYWIHFTYRRPSSSSRSDLPAPIEVPRTVTLARPERLSELYQRFIDDQETEWLTGLEASLLVLLMLSEVARAAASAGRARSDSALAGSVLQHISTHYHEPISTASIAAHLHYNPDYLGRAFRASTGGSITEAVNRRRIKEARALLTGQKVRVSDVALACGFQDPGYFRKVFGAVCGMTPRQYRNLNSHQHINTH